MIDLQIIDSAVSSRNELVWIVMAISELYAIRDKRTKMTEE
jgi:hypothetical protein